MSICRTECPSIWLSVSLHPFPIVPLSDFSNLPPAPLPRPHLGLSPLPTPHIHMKLSPGDLPARKRSHLLSHAEALSRQPPLSYPLPLCPTPTASLPPTSSTLQPGQACQSAGCLVRSQETSYGCPLHAGHCSDPGSAVATSPLPTKPLGISPAPPPPHFTLHGSLQPGKLLSELKER